MVKKSLDDSLPLHPRTWGWWVFVGVFWLLFKPISIETSRDWGKKLARVLKRVSPRRFKVIRRNLELVFPDMTTDARESLALRNLEETVAGFFEAAYILLCGYSSVTSNCEVRGREVLDAALAEGKNVLLIGAHFTCLESCGCVLGRDAPVDIVHRQQNAVVGNYLILKHRRKLYASVIDRDDRVGLISAFADKTQQRIVWTGPDQDMGHQRSVFVPFLGVEKAATLKVTSRIATRYDMNAVFVEFSYQEECPKWIIQYRPIENFPTGDQIADATTLNRIIGESVQRNPEQYYWIHRRFKSLEDGTFRKY